MVEWKKLGEVCQVLNGFAFKSSEYVPKGIRIIRISDVQNGYISDKDKVFYPIEKLSEFERYLLNNGDLVMSLTGNPGRVAFIRNESCALNQRVACLRAKTVSNSYLFYLFNCKEFESTAFANSTGGAQKNLSTTWLNNFLIPIPSLSEQTRIVGILDTFTASIDNLKEQIAQRRKQYEYYRDQLLDLEGKPGVEMKTLGDIVAFRNGKGHEKNINPEGKYIVVNSKFISSDGSVRKFCDKQIAPLYVDDILMVMSDVPNGKALAKCYLVKENDLYTLNQRIGAFHITDSDVCTRYLYYVINRNKQLLQYDNKIDQTNLRKDEILNITIPLPSPQEQQRIVTILDTFESSIQNLESQLTQREKQYEYYRNKLLTFE